MKAAKLLTPSFFLLAASLCLGQFADPRGSKSSQMHATLDWSLFGLKTEPERSFAESWARWKRKPSHPLAARIAATATYPELEQVALHLEKDQKTPFDYRMYLLFRVSGRVYAELHRFYRPEPYPALNRVFNLSREWRFHKKPPMVALAHQSNDPIVRIYALMRMPLSSYFEHHEAIASVRRQYGAQTALWQAGMYLREGTRSNSSNGARRRAGDRAKAVLDEAPVSLQRSPLWPVPRVLSEHFRGEAANARVLAERYLKRTLSETSRKRLNDYLRTGDPWHLHKDEYVDKMLKEVAPAESKNFPAPSPRSGKGGTG